MVQGTHSSMEHLQVQNMTSKHTFDRSWEEILDKLDECEREQNHHWTALQNCKKQDRMYHMRQYKGLEGAIAALEWTLGNRDFDPVVGKKN